jgi:hypothetical protein
MSRVQFGSGTVLSFTLPSQACPSMVSTSLACFYSILGSSSSNRLDIYSGLTWALQHDKRSNAHNRDPYGPHHGLRGSRVMSVTVDFNTQEHHMPNLGRSATRTTPSYPSRQTFEHLLPAIPHSALGSAYFTTLSSPCTISPPSPSFATSAELYIHPVACLEPSLLSCSLSLVNLLWVVFSPHLCKCGFMDCHLSSHLPDVHRHPLALWVGYRMRSSKHGIIHYFDM